MKPTLSKPRRWTLRARLTLLYGGLFFLAGAAMLGVTYLLVEQRLDARAPLRDSFRGPVPAFASGEGGGPPTTVRMADGREVPISEAFAEIRAEQERYRAETLDSVLTRGGAALVVVGLGAGAFGWLLAGRALAPVHSITATARRIAAGSGGSPALHERIALTGPADEVKELADTFDAMLERLDRSFDGQRRFVANASHELRTPLAINRGLIEVAVTRPGASADLQELGESLLGVNARHERLINGLLTLADSENEIAERVAVDLAEVAAHVLAQAADEATAAGVSRADSVLAPALTNGDPVLLERLVQNLVENAVRHNTAGGWLQLRTERGGSAVRLVVENTGPDVPAYDVDVLFQPFRRGHGERTAGQGFGLGLSIVRALARAHGGEATAAPRPGGGLVVTVNLPSHVESRNEEDEP